MLGALYLGGVMTINLPPSHASDVATIFFSAAVFPLGSQHTT